MATYDEIVKFHGHECTGLAIGYRMASVGLKAIESARSENEEIVSIVANDACGVGALQCVTGCTFGKGNLNFRNYGKAVRVVFNFNGLPDGIGEDRNVLTEWILSASQEDILSVTPAAVPEPAPAAIRDSVSCSICGETVMEISSQNRGR